MFCQLLYYFILINLLYIILLLLYYFITKLHLSFFGGRPSPAPGLPATPEIPGSPICGDTPQRPEYTKQGSISSLRLSYPIYCWPGALGHQTGRPASGPSYIQTAPPTRPSFRETVPFSEDLHAQRLWSLLLDDSLENSPARALLALFLALPGPIFPPFPETCTNPQPCSSISALSSSFDFLSFIFTLLHSRPAPKAI